MEYLLLFIGAASFLFSIVLLFSTLFKERLSVLFFSLLVLFGGVSLTNQFALLRSLFNPFYYFQFQHLLEQPEQVIHPLFIPVPYIAAIFVLFLSVLLMKTKQSALKGEKDASPFNDGRVSKINPTFAVASKFEWRKYQREGIVKRFTIIILMLIAVSFIFISISKQQLHDQYIERTEDSISSLNKFISDDKQRINNAKKMIEALEQKEEPLTAGEEDLKATAEAEVIGYNEFLPYTLSRLERAEQELDAYLQGDWGIIYENWLEELTLWWKDPHYDFNVKTTRVGLSDFTYLASIQEKEWLMEHQLEPVHIRLGFPFTWTIYDEFTSPIDQLQWDQDTRKIDNTGLFYVYTFFSTPSYLVLFVLLVFLLGAGLAAEKGNKRTLTFLLTQPLTKRNIFLSKTWVSMITAVAIAILSILSMVLIGTVVNRFGDWKFPVLHYDPPSIVDTANYTGFSAIEGGFHFMYMGRYLFETGGLFLAGLIFLIALSLFFSLLFKNTMSTVLTTLLVTFGLYFVSTLETISAFAHWMPFTYLNVGKIANGELAAVLGNEAITTTPGIISLLGATIILIVVGQRVRP